MCWSGEASAVIAVVGTAATVHSYVQRQPAAFWIPLGYFTSMEALQAYTYIYIDDCRSLQNQIVTLLGYLHICFQPFFINAVALQFVPVVVRRTVSPWVYGLCFASVVFMIVQLYPFEGAGRCDAAVRTLCGDRLCAFRGNWHIAWSLPLNGIGNDVIGNFLHRGSPTYLIASFLLPVLYGSWRMTLFHALFGPLLAMQLTNQLNEWPAIWCLFSIALVKVIISKRLRGLLYEGGWPLWPQHWRRADAA